MKVVIFIRLLLPTSLVQILSEIALLATRAFNTRAGNTRDDNTERGDGSGDSSSRYFDIRALLLRRQRL